MTAEYVARSKSASASMVQLLSKTLKRFSGSVAIRRTRFRSEAFAVPICVQCVTVYETRSPCERALNVVGHGFFRFYFTEMTRPSEGVGHTVDMMHTIYTETMLLGCHGFTST